MKTVKYNNKFVLVTVAILGAASFTVGAHADESSSGAPTRTVHYADLNLDSSVGAEMLYLRIRHAAEQVCGDMNTKRLAEARAAKACVDKAILSSVGTVNREQLTKTAIARGYHLPMNLNVASVR